MPSMLRASAIANAVLCACVSLGINSAAVRCQAQQATASGSEGPTPVFTLKVYTNLVQVPTLVLDHEKQALRPIDFRRFQVSIDSGKKFLPTHVRIEGEDPLDLAIVADVTMKGSDAYVAGLADALAVVASKSLRPNDRVSIYVLGCRLLRGPHRVSPDPDRLHDALQATLQSPNLRAANGSSCGTKVHLWAALVSVISDMQDAAGRRAMLIASPGRDDGRSTSWSKLHEYAGAQGMALFGLRDQDLVWGGWQADRGDAFRALCESTGGLVFTAGKRDFEKRLQQWVTLLRGRYVVEFPNPQHLSDERHNIEVSVRGDGLAFITLAGVSVSLPDPTITSDPHYVPSQQGADIPVGKRRPLPE